MILLSIALFLGEPVVRPPRPRPPVARKVPKTARPKEPMDRVDRFKWDNRGIA